jgi:hypothetical protein
MCLRASVSLAVIDKTGSNAAGLAEVGQNPGLSPSRQANLFTTHRPGQLASAAASPPSARINRG